MERNHDEVEVKESERVEAQEETGEENKPKNEEGNGHPVLKNMSEEEREIPNEILNLAKKHSNYSVTVDIFNKYRFYKRYCDQSKATENGQKTA
mmetsp:Transcript_36635/g.38028  ORF Transcript_36635/g.38028 Transcript_36635/m.38028 type:complete len:94 (+) Transcript_36635:40-321(+)|eukprot:CAMPEP_0170529430 /NCGR_PEP_ID=MMETSP0209-20121228/22524_1 /TAXON_ID=665100 ORGANISM="Litonotus pictus, Strain P1" /NCGR_SAMPLE_ID=MMETSP0209 /ASSEMBLY_ACC=CAM_ASM_000301 /LENGTH=93 /DNA_ID=CAMNT_0010821395 /DNA_START=36 /DNA_END=317 /DNA_ORIENTATION=+